MAKNRIFLCLCVGLIIAILCVQSVIQLQPAIQPTSETTITNQTVSNSAIGGEKMVFAYYTATNDFLAWAVSSGSFLTFGDTGNLLYLYQNPVKRGFCVRNFVNIATSHITNYALYIKMETFAGNSAGMTFHCSFFYTDASFTKVFDETTYFEGTKWWNGTFTAGKILDYLEIELYVTGANWIKLSLYDEVYRGFRPKLENWTIQPSYLKQNSPITFETLVWNQTYIQANLGSEFGGSTTMNLFSDWIRPHLYYNITSFGVDCLYSYSITAMNEWSISITTPIYYFTVLYEPFPHSSYLSLFNALSGFPLASKDFKIYLGDPDTRELINFRTFTGSWAVLNHNNLVNASLIINGTLEDQALVDNYIAIQAENNGLKSPFENGMTYNTTLWTMLQFQVKIFQPTWLVIIYNPVVWEKDFYLYLGAQYVGYWLDVSIPIFNFTSYVDVTHQTLYELGFWIGNATLLLANIRLARWFTWNGTAYEPESYRLCSLANRQNPNQLIFDSPTETLCIQDYYNNTLWYGDVDYAPFVDIALPICDATFYNYGNTTIIVQIYRGLGNFLEIVVPPHSAVTVPVYCTNYRVHIVTMQQLVIAYFSPNQTRTIIIPWGTEQNITFPNFWEQLLQFLFQTPLGITLVVLFCIYMTYSVYRTIRPPRIVFKVPKMKETKETKNEAELRKSVKKIKNEKRIRMG
jgi:hypothetical protein